MSRASFIATVAALLICASTSRVIAADDAPPEEARAAEQRLLGTDEEAARFAACQPFTREIAGEGAVQGSFDASLRDAGVPAAARLETRRALATAIDLGREVAAGDRFMCVSTDFTTWGADRRRSSPVAGGFHQGQAGRHPPLSPAGWCRALLAGERRGCDGAFDAPALDAVTVSSGFGMRADPFDQPPPSDAIGKRRRWEAPASRPAA